MWASNTPFTLIYGEGLFPSLLLVLYKLIIEGKHIPNQIAFSDIDHLGVRYRAESNTEEPVIWDLYVKEKLSEILKKE
jgi:hypothetical protein